MGLSIYLTAGKKEISFKADWEVSQVLSGLYLLGNCEPQDFSLKQFKDLIRDLKESEKHFDSKEYFEHSIEHFEIILKEAIEKGVDNIEVEQWY